MVFLSRNYLVLQLFVPETVYGSIRFESDMLPGGGIREVRRTKKKSLGTTIEQTNKTITLLAISFSIVSTYLLTSGSSKGRSSEETNSRFPLLNRKVKNSLYKALQDLTCFKSLNNDSPNCNGPLNNHKTLKISK